MNSLRPLTLNAIALTLAVGLAACSSLPADNPSLLTARQAFEAAQNDPQVRDLASSELAAGGALLNRANEAQRRGDNASVVDHLAYLTTQQVAVAQQIGRRKAAEATLATAEAERDRLRLAARTAEADVAQRNAQVAQRDAQSAQRDAQSAQRDTQSAQRDAQNAQREAEAAQRLAMASREQSEASRQAAELAMAQATRAQMQTAQAQARAAELEAQLRDLNAKQTDRGMVVTVGDVLFDSGRSDLKPGAERNLDKLVAFFKTYPQRKAVVEGFTDSVGADSLNLELSARRAQSVRSALLSMGVASERVEARGFGEAFPVASNDSSSGRQLNRRVEIVLSDENGRLAAR